MSNSIGSKEVAKLARKALKVAFPGSKFSVRSDTSSLSVSWDNGATQAQVEEIMEPFRGIVNTLNPHTDDRSTNFIENSTGEHFEVAYLSYNRTVDVEKREAVISEVLDYMKVSKDEALELWNSNAEQKILATCHKFGVLNVGYSHECFGSFISNIVNGRAYAG